MRQATYTKLKGGDWGLRVIGETAQPGERVLVTKRDGTVQERTIYAVVWRGNGVSLALASNTRTRAKRDTEPMAIPTFVTE